MTQSLETWLSIIAALAVGGTLIWSLTGLLSLLCRRGSAALHHRLWGLSCAAVLIAPLAALTVPLPRSLTWSVPLLKVAVTAPVVELSAVEMPEPHFPEMALDAGPEHGPPMFVDIGELSESAPQTDYVPIAFEFEDAVSPASSAPPRDWGPSLTTVVIGLWCAGLLVALAHGVLARRRITGLLRRSLAVTHEPVLQLARDLTQRLGLRRPVRVLTSAETAVPFVTGVACPALVLPTGFGAWPAERLPVVLVHELMHVKRGDVAWQSLAQMCLAATWFHPLAWLALWRLRVEREHACDDAVLLAGYRPSDYASQLVEVASDLRRGTLRFAPAVAMASRSPIERRVRAILDATLQRGPAGRWRTAATLAGLSAMLLVVAAVTPGRGASAVEEPQAEVKQERAAAEEKGKGELPADAAVAEDDASQRVQRALAEETEVEAQGVDLSEILAELAKRHQIPIRLETLSFSRRDVSLETPISLELSGITLRSALRLIVGTQLDPSIEPTIVVRHGVLVISLGPDAVERAAIDPRYVLPIRTRTISGSVRDAKGTPVAGALVEVNSSKTTTFFATDMAGEFASPCLTASFMPLSVIVRDEKNDQHGFWKPERSIESNEDYSPIALTLRPPRKVTIQVVDDGGVPAQKAFVAILFDDGRDAVGFTDKSGVVQISIPSNRPIDAISAWQRGLGFDYIGYDAPRDSEMPGAQPEGKISLQLNGAHVARLRLIDDGGQPVVGAKVFPERLEKPGASAPLNMRRLADLVGVKTDSEGEAVFDWLPVWQRSPEKFWAQSIDFVGDQVEFDREAAVDGVVTKVLRRYVELRGHVRDAAGMGVGRVRVTASGAGYTYNVGPESAATDSDGKFLLRLPPDQVYLLVATSPDGRQVGSVDGIVARSGQPLNDVNVDLKQGTRVFGRVTVGQEGTLVAKTLIQVKQFGSSAYATPGFEVPDSEKYDANPSPRSFYETAAVTDAEGRFEFFLSPGSYSIQWLHSPSNPETQRFTIADEKELEISFHADLPPRGLLKGRVITGDPQMGVAGAKITGVVQSSSATRRLTATANDRGEFSVDRELAPTVLHAETSDGQLAGIRRIGADDSHATIRLAPTASCRFRILDGPRPLPPGCDVAYGIRIENDDSRGQLEERDFGGTVQTDKDGRVALLSLVVGAEYEVRLVRLAGSRTAFLDHHFVDIFADKPGLHDRGDVELKNLGSVRHTPEQVAKKLQQFVDDPLTAIERHSAVMKVVPLTNRRVLTRFVNPDSVWFSPQSTQEWPQDPIWQDYPGQIVPLIPTRREEAKTLARQLGVSLPSDGTPLLVIQDENGKVMGQLTGPQLLSVDGQRHNRDAVLQFLRKHAPEHRHARELLVEALKQAKAVNKLVFVQETSGWPDSSVALRRFLHQHRSILSKDYVVVLLDHRSEQGAQVAQEIRKGLYWGNPWLAILDADGKVLTTSNDANGYYIGFPSKSEPDGIRHFLKMLRSTSQRMTEDDFQTLQRALEGME